MPLPNPGPGRHPLPPARRKRRLQVYVPGMVADELERKAARYGLSVSDYVRKLIEPVAMDDKWPGTAA
jgi:hypothetical protein